MIVVYIRSSSLGDWEYCQHSSFLKNCLGYRFPSNQKADMGTIVHKVLDVLASIKLHNQKHGNFTVDYPGIGKLDFAESDWLKEYTLTSDEVRTVNKSRTNKYIYKSPCFVTNDQKRYGVDIVNDIFEKVYSRYTHSDRNGHEWTNVEKQNCHNWTWMALEYDNGAFDPRRKNIFAVEKHFDITIEHDWAKYEYILPSGQEISGNLAIKGTIDLITEHEDGILEVVDYKTGQRINWATGKTKEANDFYKDNQLMLYYYALRKSYPEIAHIMLTIFFVRDGGPFSVCFEDEHLTKMEDVLCTKFNEMRSCEKPKLLDMQQKDFRCNKLCPFFSNHFANDKTNMCHRIHQEIKDYGLEYVMQTRTNGNFDVGNYQAPGE